MEPYFSFPYNFGALPKEMSKYEECDVVIFPIPYDATTTYKSGAREGPKAIINASRFLELHDEDTGKNYSENGICTLPELEIVDDSKVLTDRIEQAVTTLLDNNKKIITLGGEHSISFGVVKAFKKKYSNLSVLHIDAHADMRDYSNENQYSHACVARRISEITKLTSIGVRSLSKEESDYHKEKNIPVFYAEKMMNDDWMDKVIETLDENVYITFDLDAFDISIMPSTGTPQPGGLQWYQVIKFFRKLSEKRNVVGFDITELAPNPSNVAPDFLAAKLTYKMLGLFFS